MAEILPFKGICFNSKEVEAESVIAPPYDIISPEMRENLYRRSAYNIARIDAGMEYPEDTESDNKYTRAASLLAEWLDKKILTGSEKPCLYAYRVNYFLEGKELELGGFFGLIRLEPLGTGHIYPHECTHSRARIDRLRLLRATRANTSPIFSVYDSPGGGASGVLGEVFERDPYMQGHDCNGNLHSLWIIDSIDEMNIIRADLEGRPVFIADGHHRYETALENQRLVKLERGGSENDPYNYVLMFLANASDEGLTILPTHRIIKTHEEFPEVLKKDFTVEELRHGGDIIKSISGMKPKNVFGVYAHGKKYRITYQGNDLKDVHPVLKKLDVVILQELIINKLAHAEAVAYEMSAEKATALVDGGEFQAAFFLNPTGINEVMEVALSGQRMPPKSTYFYPKLMTGFVISRF